MGISTTSRRPLVIAVVAVLVLALVLGAAAAVLSVVGSGEDEDPRPSTPAAPTLDLSRTSTVGLADAALGGAAATGSSGYRLATTLATTTDEGVVITPGASRVDRAKVTGLLEALGMTGARPTEVDGGWTATGTVAGQKAQFALDERAGNVWQYVRGPRGGCLSLQPGGSPDDSVSCSPAAIDDVAKPVSRAQLVREAREVFAAVGVTPGSGLKENVGGGVTYLDVPLEIESLPVVDVALSVGADASGLVSASGWLDPTFTTVGRYPLISAAAGYDQLLRAPVPEIGRACPPEGAAASGRTAACPSPTPAGVTAARLAWLTSRDAGLGVVLVPAWQFEVDGLYGPAVVAVDPAFLAGDAPTDEGSGSGTGEPGSVEPAPALSPPAP